MKPPVFFFSLLCIACPLLGETSNWSGTSKIQFDGTSTLHDWGGKVDAQPFATKVTTDASGNPTRVEARVTVEAAKMDTAESKRDANMRKAMKADEYPLITGVIDAPFAAIRQGDAAPATLPLKLTLLGKIQNLTGKISNWKLNGDKASFDLNFELSLKNSGIKVPSVLLFIRVGDTIKVRCAVELKRSAN
jgi:polyisoprenoid-binding protein YceI